MCHGRVVSTLATAVDDKKVPLRFCQFETCIHLMKQFANDWWHVSSIQNYIYSALVCSSYNDLYMYIQSSAVITWSNVVRYCINNRRNWAEYQSKAAPTKAIPYLALAGELWDVFCEYLWENGPYYNGTTRYIYNLLNSKSNYNECCFKSTPKTPI